MPRALYRFFRYLSESYSVVGDYTPVTLEFVEEVVLHVVEHSPEPSHLLSPSTDERGVVRKAKRQYPPKDD